MEPAQPLDGSPESLGREAVALIASTRLDEVLKASLGGCALVGSTALNLMSWRDIDFYVPAEREEAQIFIRALPPIRDAFAGAGHDVVRATFNDEWARPRGDYGSGYYWGLRVQTPARTVWKIDIWGWDRRTFERKMKEHRRLEDALGRADRALILDLKREAQKSPGFRKEVTSWDIYQFVLSGRGTTFDELRSFCIARRAASA